MAAQGVEPEDELTLVDTLRVVSRHGSTERDAEEQAAALAVLSEVLAEEATARHDFESRADRWSHPDRAVRVPLTPGPGKWRSFSG